MPITTNHQIWTPNDTDAWDLIVDLAAMAVSIDTALNRIVGVSNVNVAPAAGNNFTLDTFSLVRAGDVLYASGQFGRVAGSSAMAVTSAYIPVATFDAVARPVIGRVLFPGLGTTNVLPGLEARITPVTGGNIQLQVRATSGTVSLTQYSSIGLLATWLGEPR